MNHIVIVQRIHSSNQVGELIASSSKKKGGASIADCFIHCILILKHCGVCRNVLSEQRNTDTVQFLEDIHIVSVKSEVKELLCILGRDVTDRVRITASELDTDGSPVGTFTFFPEEDEEVTEKCSQ